MDRPKFHIFSRQEAGMFIRTDADVEDETEITEPQEIAEAFAAIAEMMIEAFGSSEARALLNAIIERDGGELN